MALSYGLTFCQVHLHSRDIECSQPNNSPVALSKWYAANVLQAIYLVLFLLDWILGYIFRKEIFRPNIGERIGQLWLIYLSVTSFQIS
jgi:hypothetical protein